MIRDRRYGRDPRVRSRSPLRPVGLGSRDRSPRRRDELGDRFREVYDRPRVRDHGYSPGRGGDYDMPRIREPECSPRRVSDYNRPRSREFKYSPQRGGEDDRLRTCGHEYSAKDDNDYDGFRARGREYLASPRRRSGEYDSMRDAVDRKFLPGHQEMKGLPGAEYERRKMKSIDSKRDVVDRKYLPGRQEMKRLHGAEYERRKMNNIDSMRDVVDGKYLPGRQEMKGLHGAEYERPKTRSIDYSSRQHLVEGRLESDQLREPKRVIGDYDRRLNVGDRRREYDDGFSLDLRSSDCDGIHRNGGKDRGDGILSSVYHFNEGLSRGGSTSSKFQWNHLLNERGKADGVKDSSDFGVGRSAVSSDGFKDSSEVGVGRTVVSSEKDYFTKRFLDTVRSEQLFESNHMSLEAQKGSSYSSSYQLDDTVAHNTLYLGNSLHKTEDLHHDPYLVNEARDKPSAIENNCFDSKDKYGYIRSLTQPKAVATMPSNVLKEKSPTSVWEGHRSHSNRVGLKSVKVNEPLVHDGYGEMSLSRSSVDPAGRSSDIGNFAQPYISLSEEKHRSYAYPTTDRDAGACIATACGDIHDIPGGVAEEYVYQDMPRTSSLDPIIDKMEHFSYQGHLKDSKSWNHKSYSHDCNDVIVSSHGRKQDANVRGYGENPSEYKREVHMDYGNNQQRESLAYGIDGFPWYHHDKSEMLITSKEYDGSSLLQRVSPGSLSLPEPSKKMLKRRHIAGSKLSKLSSGLDMTSNGRSPEKIYDDRYVDELYSGDDLDTVNVSRMSKFNHIKYRKAGKGKADIRSRLTFQNPSHSIPSFSSKTCKSAGRDIKSRLGPNPQNIRASHTIRKKYKSSMKKRLGPGLSKNHVTLPWLKNHVAHRLQNLENGSDESLNDQGSGGDSIKENGTSSKPEPPENSEEFKQLVYGAFFKFVKVLNETPVKRRKYLEQAKAGTLKCIVCGSDSGEFEDTESLASHALKCEKAGTRCQHMGFHKALCALMGWRSAEVPRNSWVFEMLSDVETSALKEDLIIWPPVVIIHNSTIANEPEKRILVTFEELEVKLKDMGFGNKIKVCRGKPANQSTMIVKFGATGSGLLDAERLHEVFENMKRGRAEFKHASSSNSVDVQISSGDRLQEFLYGYLGIAEDLDKLDFETKKRCLVKSKKEIQSIADAPVEKSKLQQSKQQMHLTTGKEVDGNSFVQTSGN